jgi:hypothetical protein
MSTPEIDEAMKENEFWFAILNSLSKFDEMEVNGVLNGVLSPTLPEECFLSIYYRANANVSSLLELKSPKHFQAIGMLARSLFELAVDIAMLDQVPGFPIKMRIFMDLEKLRACRSAVAFAKSNPVTFQKSAQPQEDYITKNETRILGLVASTWPGIKVRDLTHWSEMRLPTRVRMLSSEMQELYAFFYRHLSWSVHPGLEGVYGIKPESFAHMCGMAYHLAALNYEKVLRRIIPAFKLDRADPSIDNRMKLARFLPSTETPAQEAQLRRELGL